MESLLSEKGFLKLFSDVVLFILNKYMYPSSGKSLVKIRAAEITAG